MAEGGLRTYRIIAFLCGFFCWTRVMSYESNFSDIYNYNYNYRDPEYQVAVPPPVAVYATLLVIPVGLNCSFLKI